MRSIKDKPKQNQVPMMGLVIFFGALLFISCRDTFEGAPRNKFGIFGKLNDSTVVMNGTIKTRSVKDWDKFISQHTGVSHLVMRNCPGSSDDEANLALARKVRMQGLHIHLPEEAEIASGAVDFYLAGLDRTRASGSKIGVHSWSDGRKEATDFLRGDEVHQPYIRYYVEMGLTQKEAEEFYFFTIDAAPANDIYWMTTEEINRFGLVTME